jgi:hypothetical protein
MLSVGAPVYKVNLLHQFHRIKSRQDRTSVRKVQVQLLTVRRHAIKTTSFPTLYSQHLFGDDLVRLNL